MSVHRTKTELGTVKTRVRRYDGGLSGPLDDLLAVEEPLEIRVAGESVAVTMRTPGFDRFLALGFLFGEGIIEDRNDIGRAEHCGRPGTPEFGNVIDVLPAPGVNLDPESIRAGRRGTLTSSACGVCGREKVDDLVDRCKPLSLQNPISAKQVIRAQEQMQQQQPVFKQTGGVHAAATFDASGNLLHCFEDVGRHNAVDKVIGALFDNGDLANANAQMLTVSSRASFEIVQKAAMAQIPVIVAVSAASSLAVSLAEALKITLIGFARQERLVVYTGNVEV